MLRVRLRLSIVARAGRAGIAILVKPVRTIGPGDVVMVGPSVHPIIALCPATDLLGLVIAEGFAVVIGRTGKVLIEAAQAQRINGATGIGITIAGKRTVAARQALTPRQVVVGTISCIKSKMLYNALNSVLVYFF